VSKNTLVLLTAGLVLAVTSPASGYCRTRTCNRVDAPPEECPTSAAGGCSAEGEPIAWPDTCVSTSVSTHGSTKRGISADDMRGIVQEQFQKWTGASCEGGGAPRFIVDTFPDVNCTDVTGKLGYRSSGPNYNIWIFRDIDWPYDSIGENAIAITTTQFSPTTGEIYDSDVELNSRDNEFASDLGATHMDLPSVVLHESGHFLGLAHSDADAAVMQPTLDRGVSRRDLAPDDVLAICATYPPGELNPYCDPEPRHGFSTECGFEKSSCSFVPGRNLRNRHSGGAMTVGLFIMCLLRRRRSVLRFPNA
jgi:hypothetical protein